MSSRLVNSAPSLKLGKIMSTKTGRAEVKSLEREYVWILVLLRTQFMEDPRFWALIVENYTNYSWSIFLKSKSDSKNKIFTLLTDLNISGIDVKLIHYDDSGENKSLYDSCQENGHMIKFEFSDPRTPQLNGKVERKFQIFYGRIRARFDNGGIEDSVRTGVWAEFARITTFLSNIILIKAKDKCPYEIMFSSKSKLPQT
jgi:hypothetical protein